MTQKEKVIKRKDKSKNLLGIISILLALVLIGSALWIYDYKLAKDKEIRRLNELLRLTEENNIIIPIDDFKEYATRYGSMTRFAQRYFPDEFVYIGYGGIVFSEIKGDLPKNPFNDYEKLTFEDNRAYYKNNDYISLCGIDVSEYQGYIDWKKVKNDGIDFAYIRVGYRGYTEGVLHLDAQFYNNMQETKNAKMPIGVYFFSGAINEKEAIAEADFVIRHISNYNVAYPIAFDMEDVSNAKNRMKDLTVEERTKITIAFCERIKEKGYQPMVYGNAKWLLEKLDFSQIVKYDIWYANWDFYNWPYNLGVYQYSSNGKVDGISGRVDMNVGFFNYQP